ncbi:hypothetical protein ACQ4M3_37180 [Leptolyngbya sp. AN03gr2]
MTTLLLEKQVSSQVLERTIQGTIEYIHGQWQLFCRNGELFALSELEIQVALKQSGLDSCSNLNKIVGVRAQLVEVLTPSKAEALGQLRPIKANSLTFLK